MFSLCSLLQVTNGMGQRLRYSYKSLEAHRRLFWGIFAHFFAESRVSPKKYALCMIFWPFRAPDAGLVEGRLAFDATIRDLSWGGVSLAVVARPAITPSPEGIITLSNERSLVKRGGRPGFRQTLATSM